MHHPIARLAVALALCCSGAAASVAPASAAVTCEFSNGVIELRAGADGDQVGIVRSGNDIAALGGNVVIPCAGGSPTVTNTNTVLYVDDSDDPSTPTATDGDVDLVVSDPAGFAPGKTAEATGASEIEFIFVTNAGTDELTLIGPSNSTWAFGDDGANFNLSADGGAPDRDVLTSAWDRIGVQTAATADAISFQGGAGTGAPYDDGGVNIQAGGGGDVILGSARGDRISGGDGDDEIHGFAGDDVLRGGPGNDQLDGGADADEVDFSDAPGPVTVDMADGGAQNTGAGIDTITGVRDIVGSTHDDVVIAAPADASVDGRGGLDTVDFRRATVGLTIDLANGFAQGTGQTTILEQVENAAGSPFPDTIQGSAVANVFDSRDGGLDIVRCGDGIDSVRSDRRSLDAIDATCENVDALPEPPAADEATTPVGAPAGGAGAPPGASVQNSGVAAPADRAVRVALSGATRQRVLRTRKVSVALRCGAEACLGTVRAQVGAIKGAAKAVRVPAGRAAAVKVPLTTRQLAKLRRSRRARVVVQVSVVDAAGNRAAATRRIQVAR